MFYIYKLYRERCMSGKDRIPLNISGRTITPEPAVSTAYRKMPEKIILPFPQNSSNRSNRTASNLGCIPLADRKQNGVVKKRLNINGNYECEVLACSHSNFNKVQPELVRSLKYMLQAAEEQGCTLLISDVTRTIKTQEKCHSKKGDLVARGGESPHNYGAAVDIVLYKNGKAVNVDSDEYKNFAQRVLRLSGNKLEWGGEWEKKGEKHHFELRNWEHSYKNSLNCVG